MFLDLACAVVEVFGDSREIELAPWRVARPAVTAPIRLLDLRENGAMLAGTFTELTKTSDLSLTWAWSRLFYENGDYEAPDGLLYAGAHNDGPCVALFERAQERLDCVNCSLPLDHPLVFDELIQIADDHNMGLALA